MFERLHLKPQARATIEKEIERLILLLDQADCDPDLEEDDPFGQCDEDGVNTTSSEMQWFGFQGPGCPIADDDTEYDCREEDEPDVKHDGQEKGRSS